MSTFKLTTEQQAKLLHKADHEPRRGQKRYLKDLGGEGSAEELDHQITLARDNPNAVAEAKRLDRKRSITARTLELGLDGRLAEMLADLRLAMEERGLTQADIAAACGWSPPLVSEYLNGVKEPGARNLAKIASALGCVWRLEANDHGMRTMKGTTS